MLLDSRRQPQNPGSSETKLNKLISKKKCIKQGIRFSEQFLGKVFIFDPKFRILSFDKLPFSESSKDFGDYSFFFTFIGFEKVTSHGRKQSVIRLTFFKVIYITVTVALFLIFMVFPILG